MPVFRLSRDLVFPDPALARSDGLLAVGGDLSPERLLLAYGNGIFPWYSAGDPIMWWSPPVRPVLVPRDIHGRPIKAAARDFGLSRPTYYQAQDAFQRDGLPGLLPERKGPRRAHKLSAEVMTFIAEALRADTSIGSPELARRLKARFKLKVHPRSIERALERSKKE